ncbi:MAG: hypothetical protein WD824_22590 [Cyclobacteriaceae bacterium]
MKSEPFDDAISPSPCNTYLFSVRKFRHGLDLIRKQALERYSRNASDGEKDLMERFTDEYIRRIIEVTDVRISAMPEKQVSEGISVILSELFDSDSPFLTKKSADVKRRLSFNK